MDRNVKANIDGWDISLQRNVHMYCHALSVKKGQYQFGIDCEDLVTEEKTIGVWLYSSEIPKAMIGELQKVLLKWVSQYEVKFQIHTSKEEFVTNK